MSDIDLVERADELAAIDAALEHSLAGDGRLVLVEGAAGVGKSALLAAAATRARQAAAEILFARAATMSAGLRSRSPGSCSSTHSRATRIGASAH